MQEEMLFKRATDRGFVENRCEVNSPACAERQTGRTADGRQRRPGFNTRHGQPVTRRGAAGKQ